ncbi:MAG: rRNA synthase [Chloroflexota bacterium]|nr:rRNA synthase [Chloroflexota bacterium]
MTAVVEPQPAPAEPAPRLDVWMVRERGISRTAARALIDAGRVRVDGRPGRPSQRVEAGASVEVAEAPAAAPAPQPAAAAAEEELRIVHEDEWLAVIDKPAGLVVHPAPGHPAGTLADALRRRGDTWSTAAGEDRPGIVHRLDRFTSGLLVVAKTEAAHRALSAQLADRTLGRNYWAMVWGSVAESSGEIVAPIGRDPRQRQRMAVVDGGRAAQSDFQVVERLAEATVLDVSLRSGRTHQIRVHLAWVGRPVVGDPLYGRREDRHSGRPALHARRLRLVHPADGAERVYEAPLPADLVALLQQAREGTL